jgi:hypothetical protein
MRTPHHSIWSSRHPNVDFLRFTGRAIEVVLGAVLLVPGTVLAFTGFFAYIGVPMMAIGLVLIVRGVTRETPAA